jgi:hypothetical protein
MKEKRSKKESNKEEAKKETEVDSVLALEKKEKSPLREGIKIDWPSFIRFYNATLKPDASRKRFAKNSANGARKGHAEPSATKNTSE